MYRFREPIDLTNAATPTMPNNFRPRARRPHRDIEHEQPNEHSEQENQAVFENVMENYVDSNPDDDFVHLVQNF